ncbi:MAG: hypothetical protein QUS14_13910 [Pyrinomonadaceae bacterium]|nr:hypothetical protein [Pyrinomonadaceae bacterium]
MDVYQKVLTRLMDLTGGKETVDVDLADLLKKEGFFPSIDSIRDYMSSESWITVTSRKNIIRITHWGVAAAKKAGTATQDSQKALKKEINKLAATVKELSVKLEDLASDPTADKFKQIQKDVAAITSAVKGLEGNF